MTSRRFSPFFYIKKENNFILNFCTFFVQDSVQNGSFINLFFYVLFFKLFIFNCFGYLFTHFLCLFFFFLSLHCLFYLYLISFWVYDNKLNKISLATRTNCDFVKQWKLCSLVRKYSFHLMADYTSTNMNITSLKLLVDILLCRISKTRDFL